LLSTLRRRAWFWALFPVLGLVEETLLEPGSARARTDGSKRHHLPSDLGKSLGTTSDFDEPVIVDRDDIARFTPTVLEWLDDAGFRTARA
jgi:hypothetical protein